MGLDVGSPLFYQRHQIHCLAEIVVRNAEDCNIEDPRMHREHVLGVEAQARASQQRVAPHQEEAAVEEHEAQGELHRHERRP